MPVITAAFAGPIRPAGRHRRPNAPPLRLPDEAATLAGAAGTKGSTDTSKADELLAKIEEINKIFWEAKQG